jgi:hypothetical protein
LSVHKQKPDRTIQPRKRVRSGFKQKAKTVSQEAFSILDRRISVNPLFRATPNWVSAFYIITILAAVALQAVIK